MARAAIAALLALVALLAAPPLAAVPVGEEVDADVESVSSACPRRAAGAGGLPPAPPPTSPPFAGRSRPAASPAACAVAVRRGTHRPHPRC